MKELSKAFEAKQYEDSIYKRWEESGFFNPDVCVEKGVTDARAEAFTVILPPPNVTGTLHMGHASMLAIEDLMVRYHRMKGEKTLWLPGTDHAAIATQSKVEKMIKEKEGKSRYDLGRDPFLARVHQFAKESHDTIVNQCKKMGSSLDWSREAFTLDEPRNRAVRTMFKKMYDDGLIYRGSRIVNWDPKGQTTISDDELVYVEEKTTFYYFKYGPFVIGTARPETKFGDKYVVMHPDDERYAAYKHGDTISVEWINGPITATIIKDTAIDMAFGTGVMTITPWHSVVDFEIAERHGLEKEQIIDEAGKLLPIAGEFSGLPISKARAGIVEKLRTKGLLVREEDYAHQVATAERTGALVEPQIKLQWFVNVNKEFERDGKKTTLKSLMQEAVKSKNIEILPDRFEKIYFSWINNLRDWCISRQIWYGHQIPVWYRGSEIYCGITPPAGEGWVQDSDSLDTWFSSGLWTFSTLGWPETTIHFVRHGEAENNAANIVDDGTGPRSFPLTKKGREQVKKTAKALAKQSIGVIISSPVPRAKETAEIIASEVGVEIMYDEALREIGMGDLLYTSQDEFHAKRGDFDRWHHDSPHGVESYDALKARTAACLEKILETYRGKTVVIVSHGDPIATMKKLGTKLPDGVYDLPDTGSATTCTFNNANTQSTDFSVFHPTSVLETGYDIIFFWVARMILMATYALDQIPFRTVYLHGLVRDAEGKKMSKSLGNIIDPLDMIEKYGTDATRLSLLVGNTPGNDLKLSEEKIAGFRNFTNKIWNISRFMLLNIETPQAAVTCPEPETATDAWILSELSATIEAYSGHLDQFEYSQAGELLRAFTYDTLADWYLELAKLEGRKDVLLNYILNTLLTLWHPFMPFVTETIWQEMYGKDAFLMVQRWPEIKKVKKSKKENPVMSVQKVVLALRQLKSDYRISKAEEASIVADKGVKKELESFLPHIAKLAGVVTMTFASEIPDGAVHTLVQGVGKVTLTVKGQVDTAKEKIRIQKEIDSVAPYLQALKGKLSNESFVSKAPPQVIEIEKKKLADAEEKLIKLTEQLASL